MGWGRSCLSRGGLLPIREELFLPFISQRMLEELLKYFVRHRGDVRAHARRFDYVDRMSQARRQHFRLPFIVVVDFNNLFKQP